MEEIVPDRNYLRRIDKISSGNSNIENDHLSVM